MTQLNSRRSNLADLLVDAVEMSIENMMNVTLVTEDKYSKRGVAIQPLKNWEQQEWANTFRLILKGEFEKCIRL